MSSNWKWLEGKTKGGVKRALGVILSTSLLVTSIALPSTAIAAPYITTIGTTNSPIYNIVFPQKELTFYGTVEVSQIEGRHYELGTNNGVYILIGSDLDRYVGRYVVVKGQINKNMNIWMKGTIINVKSICAMP